MHFTTIYQDLPTYCDIFTRRKWNISVVHPWQWSLWPEETNLTEESLRTEENIEPHRHSLWHFKDTSFHVFFVFWISNMQMLCHAFTRLLPSKERRGFLNGCKAVDVFIYSSYYLQNIPTFAQLGVVFVDKGMGDHVLPQTWDRFGFFYFWEVDQAKREPFIFIPFSTLFRKISEVISRSAYAAFIGAPALSFPSHLLPL